MLPVLLVGDGVQVDAELLDEPDRLSEELLVGPAHLDAEGDIVEERLRLLALHGR